MLSKSSVLLEKSFFKNYIYLKETKEISHVQTYSPKACKSRGWIRPMPRGWISIWSFPVGGRNPRT